MADKPQQSSPAPKLDSTRTRAPGVASGTEHDDKVIDEALDESFPASDPAAIVSPGSTLAVKKMAEEGRAVPDADTAGKVPKK